MKGKIKSSWKVLRSVSIKIFPMTFCGHLTINQFTGSPSFSAHYKLINDCQTHYHCLAKVYTGERTAFELFARPTRHRRNLNQLKIIMQCTLNLGLSLVRVNINTRRVY